MSNVAVDRGILLPFVRPAHATGARTDVTPPAPHVSLLHPDFERKESRLISLWMARLAWRRRLRKEFEDAPEEMLADFGLTRRALDDYLARPFWAA